MKKAIILGMILLIVVGCSSKESPKKVHESVSLPHVLVDEKSDLLDENGNEINSYLAIESVTIRDLTDQENEYFLDKIKSSSSLNLNDSWSIVEVNFGSAIVLDRHVNPKDIEFTTPKIILGDEILFDIQYYKEEKIKENIVVDSMGYGEDISSRKYLYLVSNDSLKEGVQIRLNNEIYLDLEIGG